MTNDIVLRPPRINSSQPGVGLLNTQWLGLDVQLYTGSGQVQLLKLNR